jgi:transposase
VKRSAPNELRVPRLGRGRRPVPVRRRCAGTRPTPHAHRAHLRARGIVTVIPEPADQIANRKRRGSAGGRPVSYDIDDYKNRNVIERAFSQFRNWRGLATRYDKYALVYRGGLVLSPSSCGSDDFRDTP